MFNYFTLLCVLFQLFLLCCCHESDESFNKTLKWPTRYHFLGERIFLMSGLVETFEIWYNIKGANTSYSRKDFYNGTVKTLYIGETENSTAYQYSVYPMTVNIKDSIVNTIMCEKAEYYSSDAEDFLPDTDLFVYQGLSEMNGHKTQLWLNEDKADVKTTQIKLWTVESENGENIPIKYETKEYDSWRGEILDDVVANFYDFHQNVTDDILVVEYDKGCDEDIPEGEISAHSMLFNPDLDYHVQTAFHSFKTEHRKTYEHEKEHNYRKNIFRNNLQRIILKNRQNLSYKLGVNKFADRTTEELRMLTGIRRGDHKKSGSIKFPYSEDHVQDLVSSGELPKNLDLRVEGLVRPVDDQLNCGSCWAFTTTATIEGAVAKSNGGRLLSLSQQSLVDCSWGFGNMGCDGGVLSQTFKWAQKYGVPTTEQYGSYLQKNGFCKIENMTDTYKIKGFGLVTPLSQNAMKIALYKYGPVAVAIHASSDMFLYRNGIFYDTECEGQDVNHGVTVVGYGEMNGETYWIIKNSWGHLWGEDGHMLISTRNNNCLILNSPYYVVV